MSWPVRIRGGQRWAPFCCARCPFASGFHIEGPSGKEAAGASIVNVSILRPVAQALIGDDRPRDSRPDGDGRFGTRPERDPNYQ